MNTFKFLIFALFYSVLIFSQEEKKIDSLHTLYTKYENTDLTKANEYAHKSVLLNKEDTKALISYNNYVEVLYKQRKNELAEENVIKLMQLATKLNNKRFLCLSNLHLGNINKRKRNYDKSLEHIEKALVIAKDNNFINLEHRVLNSKAILFNGTKNREKAIIILKKILKNKNFNNPNNLGFTYNSLASSYYKLLKKKDSGLIFYEKGMDILKPTNNEHLKTMLYLNYGNLLLKTKDKEKGVKHLLLAKEIAIKCNNFKVLYYVSSTLGIYHYDNKEYDKSIEKYKEAEVKYGKYTEKKTIAHLYWLLSTSLYYNKQYKEGFEYQDKLILLKDSLFTIEKNKTFEKLQTEYEVEKKNNQIQLLEKEKELEENRKKLVFGIGGLLVFVLALLAFVYRYKVNSQKLIRKQEQKLYNQEKEQLQQAQRIKHIEGFIAGEEKEKNRIAMELHDGIGGKLSGIKHFVSSLAETDETATLSKNITDITKEVRLLSHSLSYTYSLKQPIKNLLEELQEQYKNHFTFEIILFPEDKINAISDEKKLFLYRSIQELVNNTYKYAKATEITISLTNTDEVLLLFEDNGIGFDAHKISKGIGLQNIKEKLVKFNGDLHIDSTINRGTTIIIKLPG